MEKSEIKWRLKLIAIEVMNYGIYLSALASSANSSGRRDMYVLYKSEALSNARLEATLNDLLDEIEID